MVRTTGLPSPPDGARTIPAQAQIWAVPPFDAVMKLESLKARKSAAVLTPSCEWGGRHMKRNRGQARDFPDVTSAEEGENTNPERTQARAYRLE